MANFPTSLDTLTNPASGDNLDSPSHSQQHIDANDICEALEAKVGADSSAVTTSHDYKLSEVIGTDTTVGKDATQTLTNKTITNLHLARVYPSADVTLTTGGWYKINLDTEDFDVGGDYDNTTNYRFDVPVTGYYEVIVKSQFVPVDLTNVVNAIGYNGSPVTSGAIGTRRAIATADSNLADLLAHDIRYLSAGDFIEPWYYIVATSAIMTGDVKKTYMIVRFLGN